MPISRTEAFLTGEPWVDPEILPNLEPPTPEQRQAFFETARFNLVERARKQMERGVSYRDFKVGCSVLAWHPKDGLVIYDAHNVKPFKIKQKGADKLCAERNALNYATEEKCTKIIAIVTASREKNTGDDSPNQHDVLHPCPDCLELFNSLPSIDQDTIVYSVLDETPPLPREEIERYEEDVKAFAEVTSLPLAKGTKIFPPLNPDYDFMGEEKTMQELLALYAKK